MLKSLHHAGAKLEMLQYKIVNNRKRVVRLVSVQYYFILVYCGLYTMTIDVVTWRIIKNGAFDLFTCVIFSDCQFLRYFFKKYVGHHVIFYI